MRVGQLVGYRESGQLAGACSFFDVVPHNKKILFAGCAFTSSNGIDWRAEVALSGFEVANLCYQVLRKRLLFKFLYEDRVCDYQGKRRSEPGISAPGRVHLIRVFRPWIKFKGVKPFTKHFTPA